MSATTADIGRGWRAPRRLLSAALAISVALNLCVVAGVVWHRVNTEQPPSGAERFHKLEASLNLNDQQRLAFEAYVAASRARMAQLRQDIEPLLDAAWAEIGKPQPDEAVIMQRFNDASSQWRNSQRETVAATLALLQTLNPDQRAKFIAEEHDRRTALRRRHAEEQR
jgi:Spy/CpxP family protein refolding chaperone